MFEAVDFDPHEVNQICSYRETPFGLSILIIFGNNFLEVSDYQEHDEKNSNIGFSVKPSSTGARVSN